MKYLFLMAVVLVVIMIGVAWSSEPKFITPEGWQPTQKLEVVGSLWSFEGSSNVYTSGSEILTVATGGLYQFSYEGTFGIKSNTFEYSSDVLFSGTNTTDSEWMRIRSDPVYSNIVIYSENVPSNLAINVEGEGFTNVYCFKDGKIVPLNATKPERE